MLSSANTGRTSPIPSATGNPALPSGTSARALVSAAPAGSLPPRRVWEAIASDALRKFEHRPDLLPDGTIGDVCEDRFFQCLRLA